jgi:hypothetical protein
MTERYIPESAVREVVETVLYGTVIKGCAPNRDDDGLAMACGMGWTPDAKQLRQWRDALQSVLDNWQEPEGLSVADMTWKCGNRPLSDGQECLGCDDCLPQPETMIESAPEPEGLREALKEEIERQHGAMRTLLPNVAGQAERKLRMEFIHRLRIALARPAAAEGVEGKAVAIARAALDQVASPVNRPSPFDRDQVRREIMRRALQRIATLAPDDGEQADG